MKKTIFTIPFLLFPLFFFCQTDDSAKTKLSFNGDFRFRIEQDWNSRKSDGTYRDDRTRLRYRARFGATYIHKPWVSFGFRLRTGDPKKQQDPQLTLGDGFKEFSTLPITFEKIYANFKHEWFSGWVGKNTFPFEKQNELFWSDNVFPEGISLSGSFNFENKFIQGLQINTGHFIVAAKGSSLSSDAYFQGVQLVTSHWENRVKVFPSFYHFSKMPNIPDGNETYEIDYDIVHLGAKATLVQNPKIVLGIDYYQNVKNYSRNDSIPKIFANEKQGIVSGLTVGSLAKPKDWMVGLWHTYLERYAAVDFLAQNDWARWDYSSQGSNDGRLTNFKGFEFIGGYAFDQNTNLKISCFFVDQIVPFGIEKETGNRVRLDFNIGF